MRKLKLNFWHGLILMGAVLIFLQLRSCNIEREYNNEIQKVLAYQDTVKTYASKDGTLVNYNNNLQVSLNAFLDATEDSIRLFLENMKIPEPDVITIFKDRFYVDSIPSINLGITDCKFDTTFQISDTYYNITGRVTNEALTLKSIMIPNTTTLVIGDRKEKWWKKKEYIATVTHSNPNISTEGIQSFTLKEQRSKWSIGPYVGYGFYYDPWKGNSGHGLNGGVSINYRVINWNKK